MRKEVVVFITILMLCLSMTNAFGSIETISTSNETEDNSYESIQTNQPDLSTMNVIKNTVDDYLNMDESLYKSTRQTQQMPPQPLLGGNEIFGLWVNVVYKGQSFQKQVSITPQMIRGKLTDPKYRTPIKFDVDGDM